MKVKFANMLRVFVVCLLLWCRFKTGQALYINYFAYGSNLNPDVLRRRTSTRKEQPFPFPIRCILSPYKLVFNVGNIVGSYYASVEPCYDSNASVNVVHGLLYSLTTERFERLISSEQGYFLEKVFVRYYDPVNNDMNSYLKYDNVSMDVNNAELDQSVGCMAITFRSGNSIVDTGQPSPRYLRLIQNGAKDQMLDKVYLEHLNGLECYKRSGR